MIAYDVMPLSRLPVAVSCASELRLPMCCNSLHLIGQHVWSTAL